MARTKDPSAATVKAWKTRKRNAAKAKASATVTARAFGMERPDGFSELADAQRGGPERAMLKAAHKMGGGVMQVAVEHAGDLTHRMAEPATAHDRGYEAMSEKVPRLLRLLKHKYGFAREFRENVEANARFRKVAPGALRAEVDALMLKYAEEHARLPTFNKAQDLAKEAAVALGQYRFGDSVKALESLNAVLQKGREAWTEFASRGKR